MQAVMRVYNKTFKYVRFAHRTLLRNAA